MKKTLIIIASLLMLVGCHDPSVEEILRKSCQKCQSIESGHYVMTKTNKYMSRPDTMMSYYTCDFKRALGDTIFGTYFSYTADHGENQIYHYLYTGKESIAYDDSIGTITSCDLWANQIVATRHNRTFYEPLTNKNCYPLLNEEELADSTLTHSLTQTRLDGKPCYLIDYLWRDLEPDTIFGMQTIRYEVEIWIDKKDYLPLQYTIAYDIVEQGDTVCQYTRTRLDEFHEGIDDSLLSLQVVPSHVVLKDYEPYKAPEPLQEGESVPQWTLASTDDVMLSLADLKGKVVLLDFFYQSCAPCCAALPDLQRLHEKYSDKGFAMIGIDPYDEKEELTTFLDKHGVTYPILIADRSLVYDYHVYAFPSLFLLDREGKLVKLFLGYGTGMNDGIETELLKLL